MPRARVGMVSKVKAEPMPHSPPMATPNKKRSARNVQSVGANPEAASSSENARMFHMSVGLRPNRSARRPKRKAPIGRAARVKKVASAPLLTSTWKDARISFNMKNMRKKSKTNKVN